MRPISTRQVLAMRHAALVVLLIAGLAAPGLAAVSGALPYRLTVAGTYYSGATPSGTITGTLGGIEVAGAYANGGWSLLAFGRPFASGTYLCLRICTFTGTALAGRTVTYMLASPVPTMDGPTVAAQGRIWIKAFEARDAWVAAVTAWTRANGLAPAQRSRAIADAGAGM